MDKKGEADIGRHDEANRKDSSFGRRGAAIAGALGIALSSCATPPKQPDPPPIMVKYGGPPMMKEAIKVDEIEAEDSGDETRSS